MTLVLDASVALKWFFCDRAGEADVGMALLHGVARGEIELLQHLLDIAFRTRSDAAVYARTC